jgi:hypothetical protein
MIENISLLIAFILISGPFSLFVGKYILKINQLKVWHIWLALILSTLMLYPASFLAILTLIPGGFLIALPIAGFLVLAPYHLTLEKLNPGLKFNQSFILIFTSFLIVFIAVFLSIPFINSQS